ncbi:hypothetical protein R6Q59_013120 [Mikania micrantha]
MSGPECCENPPVTSSGGESGEIKQIASLKSYVSGNPGSKLAVLLISDVYGYEAPKLRKIADKLASAGYYAVVPDFFFGDPFIPKTQLQEWLKNHEPKLAVEFAKPVIHALQEKGISKIGAAGFCWGDKIAYAGYYAVVPDFFFGDPFIPKTQPQEWLKNHEPVRYLPSSHLVIS